MASMETPNRAAIAARVSPGWTTYVAAEVAPEGGGMISVCPTFMWLGSMPGFAATMASMETPNRAAMLARESPGWTTYVIAVAVGVGVPRAVVAGG
jgi:hypothetical protein